MYFILFIIAVLSSLLSQLPGILESGVDTYLKLTWLLPGIYGILKYPRYIFTRILSPLLVFLAGFALYCVLMESITGKIYTEGDLYNITIAFIITAVSYTFWKARGSSKILGYICLGIFVTSIYLAVDMYKNFMVGYDITSRVYAYTGKNSLAQILLASMMVGLLCGMPRYKKYRYLWLIGAAILIVIIFLLKSRTTLLSLFFVCAYMMFKYPNKQLRITSVVLGLGIVIYFIIYQNAFSSIVDNFIFAGRDVSDVDDLSSGRLSIITRKLSYLDGSLLVGIGNTYIDCMPIAFLVQYGIIGLSMVTGFFIWLTSMMNKKIKSYGMLGMTTYLLYWIYMINCLFEAYPPFGPGAKCFILWMFFGFSIASLQNKSTYVKILNPKQVDDIHKRIDTFA